MKEGMTATFKYEIAIPTDEKLALTGLETQDKFWLLSRNEVNKFGLHKWSQDADVRFFTRTPSPYDAFSTYCTNSTHDGTTVYRCDIINVFYARPAFNIRVY